MVIFDTGEGRRHDLAAHFDLAARVAAQISATFQAPNELEFEKAYYPYLLFSKKRYAGESQKFYVQYNTRAMNTTARLLSLYLVLVMIDALGGFGMYRRLVSAVASGYCAVTNRSSFDRFDCTSRVFHSRNMWLLISALMGLAGGYVTLQFMKSGKW